MIVVHNEAKAIENLSHLSLTKKPSKLLTLGFREISNPLPVNPVPRIFPCNSFSILFIYLMFAPPQPPTVSNPNHRRVGEYIVHPP